MSNEALNELQRIVTACLEYGNPVICYSWVVRLYEARYGRTFHQARLRQLERLGVLAKDGETSRRGNRRYYRIINPAALAR